MAAGSFDNEIKNAMTPKSEMQNSAGKRPPPMRASAHNSGAVASKSPAPHKFQQPQSQQEGQQGLQQASGVPAPHMGGPVPQVGSHLQQAHATIVNALAQRDRGM